MHRFKFMKMNIIYLIAGIFCFSQYSQALTCNQALNPYKPQKHFSATELIAYQNLAIALLTVRIFRGDIEGITRVGSIRSSESYSINETAIADQLIQDMDSLLSDGYAIDVPIKSFLRDGYNSSRLRDFYESSFLGNGGNNRSPYNLEYLRTRYKNEDQSSVNNTERELHEFLRSDISTIILEASFIESESKFIAWLKRAVPSAGVAVGLNELNGFLQNSYSGVFDSPAQVISAAIVGALIGGTGLVVERFRNGLFRTAPVFEPSLLNRELSPRIHRMFVRAESDTNE